VKCDREHGAGELPYPVNRPCGQATSDILAGVQTIAKDYPGYSVSKPLEGGQQ
jgi:hypothetical protein